MAALHIKLLCILPLFFIINGINAQFIHFPQLPLPKFFNPFWAERGQHHGKATGGGDPYADDTNAGGAVTVFDPNANGAAAGFDPSGDVTMPVVDPNAGGVAAGGDPNKANKKGKGGKAGRVGKPVVDARAQPDFPTQFAGAWEVVNIDSGVSAMHLNLLPNNKMIMYDASAFHISNIKLPNGQCLPFKDDKGVPGNDCWSHAVEYDVETNAVRPLKVRLTYIFHSFIFLHIFYKLTPQLVALSHNTYASVRRCYVVVQFGKATCLTITH